ncbi:hypothetical protein [Streptomyces sp. NPDC059819]|uniref:hypothetical protein n=1 Tax=Streptomyces sp. NPDC059819 TaxID=3346963 RepID=UPI00365533AC
MSITNDAAAVTEEDVQEVAWALDPAQSDRVLKVMFGPYWVNGSPLVTPRDHGAVGTILSHSSDSSDEFEDQARLLAVAAAHGRVRGLSHRAATGAILLAGEITARTIHHLLTKEVEEPAVRALTCIIAELWPITQPGPVPEPEPGHPGMNLHRLLRARPNALLAPWQQKALAPLINAYQHSHTHGRTNPQLLLAIARCASYALPQLRDHCDEFTAVRDEILIRRHSAPADSSETLRRPEATVVSSGAAGPPCSTACTAT